MFTQEVPDNLSEFWWGNTPADPAIIKKLKLDTNNTLPEDYFSFFEYSNGGEGPLLIEPGWFCLWPAEEVIILNLDYGVDKWLPGFVGFGSNGGGELFAFDTRSPQALKVYMIPFGDLDEVSAILVADNFVSLIGAIGKEQLLDNGYKGG